MNDEELIQHLKETNQYDSLVNMVTEWSNEEILKNLLIIGRDTAKEFPKSQRLYGKCIIDKDRYNKQDILYNDCGDYYGSMLEEYDKVLELAEIQIELYKQMLK